MIFQTFLLVTIIVNVLSSPVVIPQSVQLLSTPESGEIVSLLPYQDCLPLVPTTITVFKKQSHSSGHSSSGHSSSGHSGHHDSPLLSTQAFIPGRYPSQTVLPSQPIYPTQGVYPSQGVVYPSQGVIYPSQGVVYPTQTVITGQPIYPARPPSTQITIQPVLPGSALVADPNFFPYGLQKVEKNNSTEPIKIQSVPISNPLLGLEDKPITLLDTLVAERELLNQKIEYLSAHQGPRETEKAH